MRLTLQRHHVRQLSFGETTKLHAGTLTVDRRALVQELLADRRLAGVDLEIVRAGESCRIVPVFDVVEPRAKLEPAGADFPGILGPLQSAGEGVTRVLDGMAVTIVTPSEAAFRAAVLDMSSTPFDGQDMPALSRYAALQHLVIVPKLADGVDGNDIQQALRIACLRAAVHLAREAQAGAPDAEEILELTSDAPGLPRVAYVFQLHSHQIPTVPGEPLLYGDNCRHLSPTILHPNEVLDGGVVRSYYHQAMETYDVQNHAVILDLYRRHGRELNFAGVVVNVANQLVEERDRCTIMSSNLVRWILKADGAVLSKSGGGAPNVDMMLVAERCEQLGIKTSMMMWETTSTGDATDSALYSSPALDAIVSLGSSGFQFDLGPVERVIGALPEHVEAYKGGTQPAGLRLVGAIDHLGSGRYTAVRY